MPDNISVIHKTYIRVEIINVVNENSENMYPLKWMHNGDDQMEEEQAIQA